MVNLEIKEDEIMFLIRGIAHVKKQHKKIVEAMSVACSMLDIAEALAEDSGRSRDEEMNNLKALRTKAKVELAKKGAILAVLEEKIMALEPLISDKSVQETGGSLEDIMGGS